MKNLFIKLFKHELVTGSFYVFLGTTFSSFLAFLLNIYFARKLSYVDYGVLAALLSFFGLIMVPASSMSAIVTRFATQFSSLNQHSKTGALYRRVLIYLILGSSIGISLSFLFSTPISKFLKISDPFLILFLIITVCANYFLALNISFLNSFLRFKFISFSHVVSGIAKIAVGVLLVFLGFRVYGALGAVLSLMVVQFIVTLYPLRNIIFSKTEGISLPLKEVLKFSIPTSVAVLALFSFVSSDVILVKHFFSAKEAGLYGALSLIGKVIFYFTLPVPVVMFPLLVKRHSMNQSYNRLFYLALLVVAIPGICITLFYFMFPALTINIFLGGRDYLSIAPYLGMFGIFLTIYSLNNTFVNYFLSIGKTKASLIVLFFAAVQVLFIGRFHDNFTQVVYVSILTSSFLLLSMFVFFLKSLYNLPIKR